MSHYSVNFIKDGMQFLRELFPKGEANELNFCLFSTSGVHGSYMTIEDVSLAERDEITFLVVHPRIVRTSYGNAEPKTLGDLEFLKKLRASSWNVVSQIGREASGIAATAEPSSGYKESCPDCDEVYDYCDCEPPEQATPVMPPLDEQDVWRSLGYDSEREPDVRPILDGARYAYEVGFNRGVQAARGSKP